ncbi:MAG: M20 family peptidase [Desulfobacterales bacterium]|nr:M20 family peptidase [Desulfobacterales bacterium]
MILLYLVIFHFVLLVMAMTLKTLRFKSRQEAVDPVTDFVVDADAVARRLSSAVQCKTIGHADPQRLDLESFAEFHRFVQKAFPNVHEALQCEPVNEFSRLYTWSGSDPTLAPVILMAHIDVVPIAEGTEADWTHPPFSGDIADGFIWGRGSLDDKGSLMGTLEAVEALLATGHRPRRTVYLAFGHDEETRGSFGAARIAEILKSRGVRAEFILDEAGAITTGMIPGITAPVAMIGIAEKGYLTLELEVSLAGGHAAMPPKQTAIGILAQALVTLEKKPFPARFEGATKKMFDTVGPEMPFGMRFLFANNWLLRPLIQKALEGGDATRASLRTTTAVTVFRGGKIENVLPDKARAMINFRLLPGDTSDSAVDRVRRTIDDPRVSVAIGGNMKSEPSRVSDPDSPGYRAVERSVRQVFPDALVTPFLVQATTDTPHYSEISDTILRFFPARLAAADLPRIHGTDERIAVDNMVEVVRFYAQVIRNADEMG